MSLSASSFTSLEFYTFTSSISILSISNNVSNLFLYQLRLSRFSDISVLLLLYDKRYLCVFHFFIFLHPSYFILPFEFSVRLDSCSRISNVDADEYICTHQAYLINYHIHHRTSSARNMNMS